jgi:hypothetical protein
MSNTIKMGKHPHVSFDDHYQKALGSRLRRLNEGAIIEEEDVLMGDLTFSTTFRLGTA